MLIQLLAELSVGRFVTFTFKFGAAVTRAIFIGALVGVRAFDSLPESLEIDDVAHDDSRPPLPSALPPESRPKDHDDRNSRTFRVMLETCSTIIAAPQKPTADNSCNMSYEIQFNGAFLSFTR